MYIKPIIAFCNGICKERPEDTEVHAPDIISFPSKLRGSKLVQIFTYIFLICL